MTERIESLLARTFEKEQAKFRRDVDWKPLLARFVAEKTDDETRARMGLEAMLAAETPAFMEGERLHFLRTVRQIPDLHGEDEMAARRASGTAFGEKGVVFNLTADFAPTIRDGLDARLAEMAARLARARAENDAEGISFLGNAILSVKAVLGLVDRYAAEERARGKGQRTEDRGQTSERSLLSAVHTGAKTFPEAL